ncbi:response regulator transcription factor [Virgibacillus sp. NKC19-3]|uniref:response regulator transcription factor n=1 Tax=Virgibacillus saliphilus TaxID=2831674 RepID=UPI001C9A385E|nr:response regulator transcription factor [Virgibacillus sp. NKC19-3]MBY7141933.1 response regulator transcription factor [Virgibacillus sp. NKC19-3]
MMESNILLVDDDQHILDLLYLTLEREQFKNIYTATTGEEALNLCRSIQPSLIVLDIMLPDFDGFSLCKEMRVFTQVPILFLTAKTTDLDKLSGFSFGGDDYITKPFNPLEVAARIKAQLNRQQLVLQNQPSKNTMYDFERFQIHEKYGQLIVNGESIICPAKEFQLLLLMAKHPNQIFSRRQLYERIWGEDSLGEDSTVIVHIRRLRKKIEKDPSNPCYLITVRGLGYKLVKSNGRDKL